MHRCNTCRTERPLSEYRVRKNGYRIPQCRECERAYQREWSKREPEKYRTRKRESMARRRAADPESARQREREWVNKNRQRVRNKQKEYHGKRFFWSKTMRFRGEGRATPQELARLWKKQRGRCALTGRRLDRKAEVDHIQAKARGGSDRIDNLRWVCRLVNFARRDLPDDEFFALCGDVMTWLGERIALVLATRPETGHV